MTNQVRLAGVGCLVALLLGCGTGGEGTSDNGSDASTAYTSPNEVFDAMKAASTKADLPKFMGCLSAKSQNEFTFGMVMMGGFLPMQFMDDEAKAEALGKEIEAVMTKHGLTEDKMDAMDPMEEPDYDKIFAPVKDRSAFIADLYSIIAREDPDTPLKMLASATLKDVKIDGDKATGKMVVDGNEEDVEFVKVDGSWLVVMPG